MLKSLLVFFILFCIQVVHGQTLNLIPDSSFENNKGCPWHFNQLNLSKYWYSATAGTPDLFSICGNTTPINPEDYDPHDAFELISARAPVNDIGFQYPHSGNTYAGFSGYASINKEYAEYMAVRLVKPLEKGKTYHVRMYISLADMSFYYGCKLGVIFVNPNGVDAFGQPVKAAKRPMLSSNTESIKGKVDILFDLTAFNDTVDWKLIEGDFTSYGGEEYMVMGSFGVPAGSGRFPAKNKDTGVLSKRKPYAYYYFDDISVTEQVFANIDFAYVPPVKVVDEKPFIIPNLLFETNKWDIIPKSYPTLDSVANYLKTLKGYQIEVAGHTDDVGEETANKSLSQNRAKSVADYLISKGVNKAIISSAGYGESMPIDKAVTLAARAINRRVEIKLIRK